MSVVKGAARGQGGSPSSWRAVLGLFLLLITGRTRAEVITNTVYVNFRNGQGVAQPTLTSSTTFTVTGPSVEPPPLPANPVVVSIFDTTGRLVRRIPLDATGEGVTIATVGDGDGRAAMTGGAGVRIVLSDGTSIVWDGRDSSGVAVPAGIYSVRVADPAPDGREQVSTASVFLVRPYERIIESAVLVPNPADEAVWIAIRLADTTGDISILVYDIAGELVFKASAPGTIRSFRWDLRNRSGTRVADGLYIVVIESADSTGSRRDRAVRKLAVGGAP